MKVTIRKKAAVENSEESTFCPYEVLIDGTPLRLVTSVGVFLHADCPLPVVVLELSPTEVELVLDEVKGLENGDQHSQAMLQLMRASRAPSGAGFPEIQPDPALAPLPPVEESINQYKEMFPRTEL